MSTSNAIFVRAVTSGGGAPDQRRATPETPTVTVPGATEIDVTGPTTLPSVTISASAISVKAGDTLLGTIIGPDAQGNRHFIAAQGIFSVDPQSALEGLSKAAILVTSTNRGIQAVLLPDITDTAAASVPVKLQLVQANIAALTTTLDTHDLAASDTPITLATAIGEALRSIGQILPQGFSLTPKVVQTELVILDDTLSLDKNTLTSSANAKSIAATGSTVPIFLSPIPSAAHDTVLHKLLPHIPLAVGLQINVEMVSTDSPNTGQNSMSVLADLPDSKTNRSLILQSPLFAGLLKSGRLIVIGSSTQPHTMAQILSQSDVAQLGGLDQPITSVTLQTAEDQPLPLGPDRLLLLLSTTATRAPPIASKTSIEAALLLTPDDDLLIRTLQSWLADRILQSGLQQPSLPTLKSELPAEILLLFNIIGRKLPSPALRKLVDARYVGDELAPGDKMAMENITQLVRRSTAPAATTEAQQRLVIPLQLDSQIVPLVFAFSPPQQRDSEQDERDANTSYAEKEQIFALSIEFIGLGPLTLRGRCDTQRLDLVVETQTRLPETLENSAKALFFETLEAAAMNGHLRFDLTSDRGWQSQSPAL